MQKHHPLQNDDPRVIILDRGNYTTCTVILKGACITSWKIEHVEQIFISRISKLDDYSNYRGGISLVFPHFGNWRFGRNNGFARDLMWKLRRGPEFLKKGDVYLELYLPSNSFTRACWNFNFELRYSIILRTNQLETRMAVVNTSFTSSFEFHFEQHSHLKVEDIRKCIFFGLQGCYYLDQTDEYTDADKPYSRQKEEQFTVKGQIDRVIRDSPSTIEISSLGDQKMVIVRRTNLPDLHLWNPGFMVDKIPDLDDDEPNHFIVVDSGNVCQKRVLPPNSFWTASQIIEIAKFETRGSKIKSIWDYIEDYC